MPPAPLESLPDLAGQARLHLHLKVVPGASREELVGPYGERLKVRVRAAAESGKANKALLKFLGSLLGVAPGTLSLVRGTSSPLKTIEIRGVPAADAERILLGDA